MSRIPRSLPLVMLGVLTLATLGAPLALWIVLSRIGRPDRFTIWALSGAACALVAVLLVATIAVSLSHQRAEKRARALDREERDSR